MSNRKEFEKYAAKHHRIKPDYVEGYVDHVENMTRSVIVEDNTRRGYPMNVFDKLIDDRIMFFNKEVNDETASVAVAQLLFLESVSPEKDIIMYIHSPGGSIHAGLAIHDTMQYIKPDVATVCIGMAASMGAVLLAAGQPGKRSALPHARIMIHQPMGGIQGQAKDIEITFQHITSLQKDLYKILAERTGKSFETIERDADRDYWMRADEAKVYGMIDQVLEVGKK